MYWYESWTIKKAEFWRTDAFEFVVLEKTLESLLDYKKVKPVNPKGNQLWILIGRIDAEAEGPILWPPDVKSWLIGKDLDLGKDPDAGKDWRQRRVGRRGCDGWIALQTQWTWVWANSGRQGSLACCSSWGCKELDKS